MAQLLRLETVGMLTCIAVALAVSRSEAAEPGGQKPAALERTIKVTMKYLLYLPKDYDQKDSLPLLLFLHGAGERGDDLERVKLHGPPKLIASGKDFPFIVVSPQCPSGHWWEPVTLAALLDEIVEQYKVDKDRLYVTGLSMGGFGTWSLAAHQPNRFAALVPICGGGEPITAKLFSYPPVWAFHGAKDLVVPLQRSEQMVDALKRNGGTVKCTVYPEAGHDAWTETYANPELYEWLLQQTRSAAKAAPASAKFSPTEWKSTFDVDKKNLVSRGKTSYFILEPGYRLHFSGDNAALTVTVLDETKVVDGVETRIVEEREEKDGQLIEVSRNYFAIDKTNNAVYYFGEDVDMYKNGKVVSHDGAWLSGEKGAKFGLMMPGAPKVGDKFQQEIAPDVAMDRCEIVALGAEVRTPAGTFKDCVKVKESTPLEKGSSVKVYAPGVGLVQDDEFVLDKQARDPNEGAPR